LIEVRKPGRPLESCGHSLNSCRCGKLDELFSTETLNDPIFQQPELSFITEQTPPQIEKQKSRVRGNSRVGKKIKKKGDGASKVPGLERGVSEIQDPASTSNSRTEEEDQTESSELFVVQEQNHSEEPEAHQAIQQPPMEQVMQYQGQQGNGTVGSWNELAPAPVYTSTIEDLSFASMPRSHQVTAMPSHGLHFGTRT
jgi:hypothetical protein